MTDAKDFMIWAEKYRPHKIEDTILPEELKKTFKTFVTKDEIPNLILSGKPGTGKTTSAKAMLDEIGADYIEINGSLDGNIDTLRVDIQEFASSVSFGGGRKFVLLDEADHLNPQSTQPALRNFIEKYSKNCGFILTCNHVNKIHEAIRSRCSVVDFKIPADEMQTIAAAYYKRAKWILKNEKVPYDNAVLAEVIKYYFPDFRRVLGELQRYSSTGQIDEGILSNKTAENLEQLFGLMKEKNFTDVRKWVAANSDIDSSNFYRQLFDELPERCSSTTATAEAILTLAEYQYKEAFVANPEINRVAMLAELMAGVQWK